MKEAKHRAPAAAPTIRVAEAGMRMGNAIQERKFLAAFPADLRPTVLAGVQTRGLQRFWDAASSREFWVISDGKGAMSLMIDGIDMGWAARMRAYFDANYLDPTGEPVAFSSRVLVDIMRKVTAAGRPS
jgi:hypothetical protein